MKIRQIRMKRLLITESHKEEDDGQDYKAQYDEDNDNDDYDLLIVITMMMENMIMIRIGIYMRMLIIRISHGMESRN